MAAIEFEADVKEGRINIPDAFKEQCERLGHVRISIFPAPAHEAQHADIIGELLANPLRITPLKPLRRDEIYARHN